MKRREINDMKKRTTLMFVGSIYEDGYRACREGKMLADCPYDVEQAAWVVWTQGYIRAHEQGE